MPHQPKEGCRTGGRGRDIPNPWGQVSTYWVRRSERVLERYVTAHRALLEVNRALLALFGGTRAATAPETELAMDEKESNSSVPGLADRQPGWTVDRSTAATTDIEVGDTVRFTKELTDEDVRRFARSSGDTNRLHLDEAFAEQTRFEERIIHGTLLVGLISAVLSRLPGLPIYLSQDVEFLAPAEPGETLTAVCEVVEALGAQHYRLRTRVCNDADDVLINGEVTVLIDELPAPDEPATR